MEHIEKFVVGFLDTNCYVVTSDVGSDAIIVDAGGGYAAVSAYLEKKHKFPVAVLCTHGHFDHIKDAKRRQNEGVSVYAHKLDEELINGEKAEIFGRKFPIDYFTPNHFVKEGDILRFGDLNFRVIETPGHTKGSVCYILNEKYIFSGDTLFFHTYGATDFYGGDFGKMQASIRKILHITEGDMLVFTGHGENTTLREERLFNPLAE